MHFSSVTGQEGIKEQLIKMADSGKVPHAMLFTEEPGFGALPLVLSFIQYLSCPNKRDNDSCGTCPSCSKISKMIHPDLHFVFPVNTASSGGAKPVSDNFISIWREAVAADPYLTEQEFYEKCGIENKLGNISVAEASSIFRKLSMTAFEGGNKYMVVWLAERMNQEASNKLLKLMEEPPDKTFLFLVSQSPDRILTTILSRCRVVKVPPVELRKLASRVAAEYALEESDATLWARISGGSVSRVRRVISESYESSAFDTLITSLINSSLSKDLSRVILVWEEVAQLSREKQKEFCYSLLEYIRRIFILSLGSHELSFVPASRAETFRIWASRINPAFYEKGIEHVNAALSDIERNVNSKYIFADLGNRFFLSL